MHDLLPGELKLRELLGKQPLRLPALTLPVLFYPSIHEFGVSGWRSACFCIYS